MKHLSLLFLLSLSFVLTCFSQTCVVGELVFENQSQIDAFPTDYPGCIHLDGSIEIVENQTNNITNLDGFSQLESISGTFEMEDVFLLNMNGLANLTSVDSIRLVNCQLQEPFVSNNLTEIRGLYFSYNDIGWPDLSFLSNVTEIGDGGVYIFNNEITSLSGLSNLVTIEGDLSIYSSQELNNMVGLDNLEQVLGSLRMSQNQNFTDMRGLGSLAYIGGFLSISNLDNITDLEGLENLDSIGWGLSIRLNPALERLKGLDNLKKIDGYLHVTDNDNLTTLAGLGSLESVGDAVEIIWNDNMVNLGGLGLTYIGDRLSIYDNDNLVTLHGLEKLQYVGDNIYVHQNSSLLTLDGLNNPSLQVVQQPRAYNNSNLSLCATPFTCLYISNGDFSTFENNAPGCNSEAEILDGCAQDNFLSSMTVQCYFDENQNQVFDEDENILNTASVLLTPGYSVLYPNFTQGIRLYPDEGNYSVSLFQPSIDNWSLTTSETSYSLTFDDTPSHDTLQFGLYPNSAVSETVTYGVIPLPRCNTDQVATFTIMNTGTTTIDGTLWAILDQEFTNIEFIDNPDIILDGNIFGWHFSNLGPSQSIHRSVDLRLPGLMIQEVFFPLT